MSKWKKLIFFLSVSIIHKFVWKMREKKDSSHLIDEKPMSSLDNTSIRRSSFSLFLFGHMTKKKSFFFLLLFVSSSRWLSRQLNDQFSSFLSFEFNWDLDVTFLLISIMTKRKKCSSIDFFSLCFRLTDKKLVRVSFLLIFFTSIRSIWKKKRKKTESSRWFDRRKCF